MENSIQSDEAFRLQAQINALYKSQAVIQFTLDGKIVWANDNFLSVMGYDLEEIKGQHHRIFADPAYARSEEYKIFWTELGQGQFHSGEFKRFAKGGKEVWIQASYNP
ncbi:MAG: PAS domain-containing protein, partial [Rhodothermales bacterium]